MKYLGHKKDIYGCGWKLIHMLMLTCKPVDSYCENLVLKCADLQWLKMTKIPFDLYSVVLHRAVSWIYTEFITHIMTFRIRGPSWPLTFLPVCVLVDSHLTPRPRGTSPSASVESPLLDGGSLSDCIRSIPHKTNKMYLNAFAVHVSQSSCHSETIHNVLNINISKWHFGFANWKTFCKFYLETGKEN